MSWTSGLQKGLGVAPETADHRVYCPLWETAGWATPLAWKQEGKESKQEKGGQTEEQAEAQKPQLPWKYIKMLNSLQIVKYGRKEIWGPCEDALVWVTRSLWASQLSRYPATGAAQLSSSFQDEQLQGCPPLNFCSSTELRNQNIAYLFYTQQNTMNYIQSFCKRVLILWNKILQSRSRDLGHSCQIFVQP